jgi:hypothetical protein
MFLLLVYKLFLSFFFFISFFLLGIACSNDVSRARIPGFGTPNQCFDQDFLIKFLMEQSPWKGVLVGRAALMALLERMLTFYDDEGRWTSEKLLTHPTIKQYRDKLQASPAIYKQQQDVLSPRQLAGSQKSSKSNITKEEKEIVVSSNNSTWVLSRSKEAELEVCFCFSAIVLDDRLIFSSLLPAQLLKLFIQAFVPLSKIFEYAIFIFALLEDLDYNITS